LVQLGTKRTALVLYCVLLVLPTAVLGALQWRQLRLDHDSDLASIPRDAQDAARRLTDAYRRRVTRLLDAENARPFYVFSRSYFPPGAIGAKVVFVPSPLVKDGVPEGLLGWFQYRNRELPEETEVLGGDREQLESWPQARTALLDSVLQLRRMEDRESSPGDLMQRTARLIGRHGAGHDEGQEMPVVAINLSQEKDISCLIDALPALKDLESQIVQVQVTPFHVRFFVDDYHQPHAVATRMVRVGGRDELRKMPSCFQGMRFGATVMQGFVIDTQWLLESLPSALALLALDPSQRLLTARENPPPGSHVESIDPLNELGFEIQHREDASPYLLRVALDRHEVDTRLRSRELAFLSVAGMLVLSLGTGLVLLFRSVQRDLEAARRTENFVSAVTHELRTPLSAIKLYGEMLAEGWVTDESKRSEYYRRILRESTRLETLVERVLHKGQLTRNELEPEPGDLVRAIEPLVPMLSADESPVPARDLVFELPQGLPMVMLHVDCVRSIVTNLVENARKYAPVDPADPKAEPILVRVQLVDRRVRLEVLDRGPGIPSEERSRIFQAFYRIGNEATRASKGTGLGLHLVALQAEAMDASVEALAREGGGTLFRVSFRLAEEPGA
jgi:signal transduction histidine kinase